MGSGFRRVTCRNRFHLPHSLRDDGFKLPVFLSSFSSLPDSNGSATDLVRARRSARRTSILSYSLQVATVVLS